MSKKNAFGFKKFDRPSLESTFASVEARVLKIERDILLQEAQRGDRGSVDSIRVSDTI